MYSGNACFEFFFYIFARYIYQTSFKKKAQKWSLSSWKYYRNSNRKCESNQTNPTFCWQLFMGCRVQYLCVHQIKVSNYKWSYYKWSGSPTAAEIGHMLSPDFDKLRCDTQVQSWLQDSLAIIHKCISESNLIKGIMNPLAQKNKGKNPWVVVSWKEMRTFL